MILHNHIAGHIVITDFGLAKEIDPDNGTSTFCGTPEYLGKDKHQISYHCISHPIFR